MEELFLGIRHLVGGDQAGDSDPGCESPTGEVLGAGALDPLVCL